MRRYYEFALLIVIIGILATLLLWALYDVQGNMEEAGVQAEVAGIRTQLIETVAHREAFGGQLPNSDNPLDWVSNPPANYVGPLGRMPSETGVWYFDTQAKELVYRFRDGHVACFRLSRAAGKESGRGVLAGVGLLRLSKKN